MQWRQSGERWHSMASVDCLTSAGAAYVGNKSYSNWVMCTMNKLWLQTTLNRTWMLWSYYMLLLSSLLYVIINGKYDVEGCVRATGQGIILSRILMMTRLPYYTHKYTRTLAHTHPVEVQARGFHWHTMKGFHWHTHNISNISQNTQYQNTTTSLSWSPPPPPSSSPTPPPPPPPPPLLPPTHIINQLCP